MSRTHRTGLVTEGCYAEALADCDARPLTHEHFVSRRLLERFGRTFTVAGLSWMGNPRELSKDDIKSGILCERHNGYLSAFDAAICQLCDALEDWQDGKEVGTRVICGDDLERWALKLVAGFVASGNIGRVDGIRAGKNAPRVEWLRIIFENAPFPERCGFYFSETPLDEANTSGLSVRFQTAPDGETMIGVIVQLVGLTFIVSVWSPTSSAGLRYRPQGFQLGDKGAIELRWEGSHSSGLIPLRLG